MDKLSCNMVLQYKYNNAIISTIIIVIIINLGGQGLALVYGGDAQ
jgi:hypothetical protein